jgi:uncharacterized protein DUF4157
MGVGNQAMVQLLGAGSIQTKLRVSQPGDPDEAEADRAADQVVAATHAPKIQRKCACAGSGTPCAKCEEEETGTIHRSVASPMLRSTQLSLQRAPAGPATANTPDQAGNPPKPSPTPSHAHPLVVEDDAKSVATHQMRKSAFIALLRADACATADAVLTSVGRTTKSCPYIEKWLAFYEKQSSDHIERAILKYAPETATARSAHEAIRLTVMRVQRAAMTWAKTGKVTDLPADLAGQIPGQGVLGAVQSFASSTVGGALLGFLGASKSEKSAADTSADKSPAPTVSRKASGGSPGAARAHDAGAVRSQLGAGHSLDSRVQSQMSMAFGHDFSGVRVHTDSRATSLSSDLNARAFTIGSDVAFASGEYQPGTPVGDALIAHELAHVVQQSAAAQSSPMSKPADHSTSSIESPASQLEHDADLSAVGAIASIWAGVKHGLADVGQNAIPRLRSGLRLQRCPHQDAPQVKSPAAPASGAPSCAPLTLESWKSGITHAGTDVNAQAALLRQALCPLGIEVVIAGKKNSNGVDPVDYRPVGTNTINFDPILNTKQSHARQKGPVCEKTPQPEDCKTYSLNENFGYNFREGSTLYAILGPKAIDRSTPAFAQRSAEHELYGAREHTAKEGKDGESATDAEIDIWTRDFTHYFHLLGDKARGPHGEDRYFGEGWNNLLTYYDKPNATGPVRKKSIQALAAYYQNPPTSAPEAGRRGHPTTPADVKQLFDLWLSLREAGFPSSLFIRDLKAALGRH